MSTTTYIEVPPSLRDVDQAQRRLRAVLSRLPIALLVGDAAQADKDLAQAIVETQTILDGLQQAHDRVTR